MSGESEVISRASGPVVIGIPAPPRDGGTPADPGDPGPGGGGEPGTPWEHTVNLVTPAEPLGAGAPPVAPDLVRRLELPYQVARGRVRSGELVTWAEATAPRPRYTLAWTSLTQAERDQVQAFFKQDINGTQRGMDVEIDGVGSGGGVVILRPVEPVSERFEGVRRSGDARGFAGVYTLSVACEQLL